MVNGETMLLCRRWLCAASVVATLVACKNGSTGGSTCGNGILDPGEQCDDGAGSPRPCPTSCADGDACSVELAAPVGSASDCSATCKRQWTSVCKNGDGCCPVGCWPAVDDDCDCRYVTECRNGD